MTDVQPEPGREPDPNVTTPQPDESPDQREKLDEEAGTAPGRDRDPEDDQEQAGVTPPIANPD